MVAATRRPTPHVLEVDLRMTEPPALPFAAGQWISVPFGPKTVRPYSMASPPSRPSLLTLGIDVAPGGLGSRWAEALRPGDPVTFKGPTGGFVFAPADPRRPLFVAEEIGIVPIRSMLLDLVEKGFGRPATLLPWARDPAWLVYHGELEALARRHPWLRYVPVVRDAGPDWAGERGELVAAVARLVPDVEGLIAYVCGGPAAVHGVRDLLVGRGLDRRAVRWERFW